MNVSRRFQLNTLADTQSLAQACARVAQPPLTIALVGTLGTGKTQFVRYFAEALGIAPEDVTSPTYVLLQRHVGDQVIFHFDFYRLDSAAQAWDLGLDELVEQPVLVLIEWADKFPECLPSDHLRIELEQIDVDTRQALLTATGPKSQQLLESLT